MPLNVVNGELRVRYAPDGTWREIQIAGALGERTIGHVKGL